MTLNAVIDLILRFLRNSTDFQADYITVVEDRPIMSVKYSPSSSLLLLAKTITHPAARFSAIAEHLVIIVIIRCSTLCVGVYIRRLYFE